MSEKVNYFKSMNVFVGLVEKHGFYYAEEFIYMFEELHHILLEYSGKSLKELERGLKETRAMMMFDGYKTFYNMDNSQAFRDLTSIENYRTHEIEDTEETIRIGRGRMLKCFFDIFENTQYCFPNGGEYIIRIGMRNYYFDMYGFEVEPENHYIEEKFDISNYH